MFAIVASRPRGPDTTILVVPERRAAELIAKDLRQKGHNVYVTVTAKSRPLGDQGSRPELINAL